MLTHNNHNNITLLLCMLFLCTSAIQLPSKVENPTPHIVVTNGPFEFPTGRSSKRASIYGSDLSPAEFKTMYNMDQSLSAGAGKTIAIIGAYAQASLEADLAVFSTRYDLPACSTANGCFKRVSQTGDANYPTETDPDWGQEACLDVQWAHAIAPGAKKIFVEAKSDTYDDLMAAVNYASKHADYVSMSFGGAEFAKNPAFESIFATAGVSFFASSGDDGSGVNYPAASPYVISVGGTTLYKSSTTGGFAAERGWSGSGGGCSEYYSASTVQLPYSTSLCGKKRAVPDVAFAASPYSGVLVYVSQGCENSPSCWFSIGGTSLAAPVFAARSAVRSAIVKPAYVYGNNIVWRDVKVGNNGFSCLTGYDLVTGRGAWIGDVSSASTKAPSTKA